MSATAARAVSDRSGCKVTHVEPVIESSVRMNREALQDGRRGTKRRGCSPRRFAARVIEPRKRAFDRSPTLAHRGHRPASVHECSATIAVHRRPGLGILRPITSPPVRLGHVGPDTHGSPGRSGSDCCDTPYQPTISSRDCRTVKGGLIRVFDLNGREDGALDVRRGLLRDTRHAGF